MTTVYVNLYRVESESLTRDGCRSECYDSADIARRQYEEAADHPWLKYVAVAVPVVFETDVSLRK